MKTTTTTETAELTIEVQCWSGNQRPYVGIVRDASGRIVVRSGSCGSKSAARRLAESLALKFAAS